MEYLSKVNNVEGSFDSKNKKIVIKKYNSIAKDFNLKLPLTRAKVESNVINFLRLNMSTKLLRFPYIIKYIDNPPTLIMKDCNALPLIHLHPNQYPSMKIWKELFLFVYNLKQIHFDTATQIYSGYIKGQNEIKEIMYNLKIKTRDAALERPNIFCLGDLSPNNILYNQNGELYLIDFECSHWGSEGYDIGQFLAMFFVLCQQYNNMELYNTIECQFINTICDKYYVMQCFKWQHQLLPYYLGEKHE